MPGVSMRGFVVDVGAKPDASSPGRKGLPIAP